MRYNCAMKRPHPAARRGEVRLNGLVVIGSLVAVGLLGTAGLYRYLQPKAVAETERQLAQAPTTSEGRVALWVQYLAPGVDNLLVLNRISAEQPWFVTHTVRTEPPEVWGIAVDEMGRDFCRAEGLRVLVELPEPRLLAREPLVGDYAAAVPAFDPGQPVDAAQRLRGMVERLLARPATTLAKEIPGAELVVVVGGREAAPAPEGGSEPR